MNDSRKAMLKQMNRRKAMTILEVAALLECAVISARRRLRGWSAYRSCNKNGKFYTLPEVPVFDEHGLWRHEGILFSKHGNLKETLIRLVRESSAGLNGRELKNLIEISSTSSIVYQLRDAKSLRIEKAAGRMTLFDIDQENYRQQRTERETRRSVPLPKCEDAMLVFIEMIKQPRIQLAQIVGNLRKKGCMITKEGIQRLLNHHGLSKKTQDTT